MYNVMKYEVIGKYDVGLKEAGNRIIGSYDDFEKAKTSAMYFLDKAGIQDDLFIFGELKSVQVINKETNEVLYDTNDIQSKSREDRLIETINELAKEIKEFDYNKMFKTKNEAIKYFSETFYKNPTILLDYFKKFAKDYKDNDKVVNLLEEIEYETNVYVRSKNNIENKIYSLNFKHNDNETNAKNKIKEILKKNNINFTEISDRSGICLNYQAYDDTKVKTALKDNNLSEYCVENIKEIEKNERPKDVSTYDMLLEKYNFYTHNCKLGQDELKKAFENKSMDEKIKILQNKVAKFEPAETNQTNKDTLKM